MSTHDVPGKNPANKDTLHAGCWAEHDDGSLICVLGTEGGSVVYSIFEMGGAEPLEYRDAMPEKGFKDMFSWPGKSGEKWTWHDKKVFPWTRVMGDFPSGPRDVSAVATLSAAQRVSEALGLRAQAVVPRELPDMGRSDRTVGERIRDAMSALKN